MVGLQSHADIVSVTIILPSSALRKLPTFARRVRNAVRTMKDLGKCAAFVSSLVIKKSIISSQAQTTQHSWEHRHSRLRRGANLLSSRARKGRRAAPSLKALREQQQEVAVEILGQAMVILLHPLPRSRAASDWLVDS